MSSQITGLSEGFVAIVADKWSLSSMLSKVISQVARLLESGIATWVHALKEQLDSLGLRVSNLDGLMPAGWDTLEGLGYALLLLRVKFRMLVFHEIIDNWELLMISWVLLLE